jgi:hypothetical protein
MNLTWLYASLLTLLFGLGTVMVRGVGRRSRAQDDLGKQCVACDRHDWIRIDSHGLICQRCGRIPG